MKQDLTTVLKCSQSIGLPVSSYIASLHTSACVLISLPHPSHLSVTNYQVRITHKEYISTQTHTHTYTCRLAVCQLVKSCYCFLILFSPFFFFHYYLFIYFISLIELPKLETSMTQFFPQTGWKLFSVYPDNSGPPNPLFGT